MTPHKRRDSDHVFQFGNFANIAKISFIST